VKELERIEALAYRSAAEAAGGVAHEVRGGTCLAVPALPVPMLNGVVGVGAALDVDAVLAFYRDRGTRALLSVPPGLAELERNLDARGFERAGAWMKFERGVEAADVRTALSVEAADAATFGRIAAAGFGLPPAAADGVGSIVGRPGWHCFVAAEDGEPLAVGALYTDGDIGWLGIAATRVELRGRGGQNAIMRARITKARELGLRRLTVETGERIKGRPSTSYRNILRAGFTETYLRSNWRSP
jgi:GNAT superfamily N-acetyltransferase